MVKAMLLKLISFLADPHPAINYNISLSTDFRKMSESNWHKDITAHSLKVEVIKLTSMNNRELST